MKSAAHLPISQLLDPGSYLCPQKLQAIIRKDEGGTKGKLDRYFSFRFEKSASLLVSPLQISET